MSNLTQKQKNDKVQHTGQYSTVDILQIIRGDLKAGYKNISIRKLEDNYCRISKWNLED